MILEQELKPIIDALYSGLLRIFPEEDMDMILFGSYARGDAEFGSDIDVMILLDVSRQVISGRNWQVGDLAAELLMDYGIVVSPIVENRDYFNSNVGLLPFYKNIQTEGIRIVA